MRIALIAPTALTVFPKDYGGIELEVGLLARGLCERGHCVILVAKEGSMIPARGELLESSHEHYSYRLLENVVHDIVIDFSHDKALSISHPEWYQINVHQVMSLMGYPINPVLISQGQHRMKMPNVKCEIIHQHIDLGAYEPNYNGNSGYFLYMGQIIEEKRVGWSIATALETGSALKVFGPWWGDAQYMDSLRRMAEGHPKIELHDSIGGDEKYKVLREAKALLHFPGAKGFCEAGSIITLEALASGTPAIVSDNGVHREYIRDGLNGFVVNDYKDAVRLIQDGALDSLNRRDCRQSVEWANYSNMAYMYEVLCQRVLNGETWNV